MRLSRARREVNEKGHRCLDEVWQNFREFFGETGLSSVGPGFLRWDRRLAGRPPPDRRDAGPTEERPPGSLATPLGEGTHQLTCGTDDTRIESSLLLTVTDYGLRHPIALDLAGDDTNGKMPRPRGGETHARRLHRGGTPAPDAPPSRRGGVTLVVYTEEGHRPRMPRPRGGEAHARRLHPGGPPAPDAPPSRRGGSRLSSTMVRFTNNVVVVWCVC